MKIFISSDVPNNKKFPRICDAIKAIKEEKESDGMCKLVEEYAREERKKGEIYGRREGKKEGRKEGLREGKKEGEQNIVIIALELKKGISEEELISRGYEKSTINNAKLILG